MRHFPYQVYMTPCMHSQHDQVMTVCIRLWFLICSVNLPPQDKLCECVCYTTKKCPKNTACFFNSCLTQQRKRLNITPHEPTPSWLTCLFTLAFSIYFVALDSDYYCCVSLGIYFELPTGFVIKAVPDAAECESIITCVLTNWYAICIKKVLKFMVSFCSIWDCL